MTFSIHNNGNLMKFKFFLGCGLLFSSLIFISCSSTTTDTDVAISSEYIYDQKSSSDSRAFQGFNGWAEQGPIRKFGRGISNVAFGSYEIPLQVYKTNETTGGIAAWTYGLWYGIFRTLEREIIGVVETALFLFPFPGASPQKYGSGWGYGPLMEPEWVFTFDTDPYNFVYPNKPPQ